MRRIDSEKTFLPSHGRCLCLWTGWAPSHMVRSAEAATALNPVELSVGVSPQSHRFKGGPHPPEWPRGRF